MYVLLSISHSVPVSMRVLQALEPLALVTTANHGPLFSTPAVSPPLSSSPSCRVKLPRTADTRGYAFYVQLEVRVFSFASPRDVFSLAFCFAVFVVNSREAEKRFGHSEDDSFPDTSSLRVAARIQR